MKIIHVISSLGYGGAESVMYELISNLRQDTHKVICLTGEGIYKKKLESMGVEVKCIEITYKRFAQSIYRVFEIIKSTKPDVVQTWLYHADIIGGVVAKVIGIRKIFWSLHNVELKDRKYKYIGRIAGFLSYFIPSKVVCVSERVKDYHVKKFKYDKKKMVVISNGIDTEKFKPSLTSRIRIRKQLKMGPETIVFGMVARCVPEKQHKLAIEAFRQLLSTIKGGEDIRFIFIGCGAQGLRYEIKNQELEERIYLINPTDKIEEYINAFDINVLTSVSEGFGNVIGEAMACGIPCISTDVGAAKELIGKSGLVLERKDSVKELAEAMKSCLHQIKSKAIEKEKVVCRKRILKMYSLDNMVRKYRKIWDSVVNY